MEKQTGFLGISNPVWAVVAMGAVAVALLVVCALIAMMFGVDIGIAS